MSLPKPIPESATPTSPCEHVVSVIWAYLTRFAVGRRNAKTWPEIKAHLIGEGVEILSVDPVFLEERLEDINLIGIDDDREDRGFFVLADRSDIEWMMRWRSSKIAAYEREMENLEKLAAKAGWKL